MNEREELPSLGEGIESLSVEQKEAFTSIFLDVLNDRFWCRTNDIDYCNLDTRKAEQRLLQQLRDLRYFESDIFKKEYPPRV